MKGVPGDVQGAREAFGARLRDLRQQVSLTGRALAVAAGMHFTKVSRVEHGRQGLTDEEIRAWCAACGAQEQAEDLIAMARSVDSLYREWRRRTRTGLRTLQEADAPLYNRVRLLRVYEHTVIPGLFQTAAYSNELMAIWARFLGVPDDRETATAPRLSRQRVLRSGVRRFVFLLAEQVLRTQIGSPAVMVEQLDHLLSQLRLPRVGVGVVPAMAKRSFASQTGFWIWDDAVVHVESISARIEITRKDEVALYLAAFDLMQQAAVYGDDAAALITAARADFSRLAHDG